MSIGDVDAVIKMEQSCQVYGPTESRIGEVFGDSRIGIECRANVR